MQECTFERVYLTGNGLNMYVMLFMKVFKGNWRPKNKHFFIYTMHNNVFNCFYSDFGPSALQLRMEESKVIFATYDIWWYGEDMREYPIKKQCIDWCLLWILSLQRNSKTMKKISTAALVSLDYKISVPPYHTLQHAADLVFHQHWKGRNSRKSPTLNIIFSQETENKKK